MIEMASDTALRILKLRSLSSASLDVDTVTLPSASMSCRTRAISAAEARFQVVGQEAAENIGGAALRHRQVFAYLVHAVARRVLDAARQRQQRERAADRERDPEDRQRGADRAASQVAPGETGEIHSAASISRGARAGSWMRSSAISPSLTRTQRRQPEAKLPSSV